jgi:hypothetical protein
MLGLHKDAIMMEFPSDVISPLKYPELCDDGGGGVLEHQILMVHHTSPGISRSDGQPTYGKSRLGNRPCIYISQSSSRKYCRSDSWPAFEDSWFMDQPAKHSTMSWMHGRLSQASFLS